MELKIIEIDKRGSATSPLDLPRSVTVTDQHMFPIAGDVVAVRALSESVTYGNLELPTGRLAKINRDDVLLGVLGKRRALKGFVGDVPDTFEHRRPAASAEYGRRDRRMQRPSLFAFGCDRGRGRGIACDSSRNVLNIADNAIPPAASLSPSAPIVVVAGTCMNSGKTVAATEIIRQAANAGLRVAGAKLSGIACLRDTLNMQDHGAVATASFLDCGLPSTVDHEDLAEVSKGILNHLNSFDPDLIVAELGDGIVGGYAVDSILKDQEIKSAISSFVFCASDYVGVIGGVSVLERFGIDIDVIAGSVTDSQMGEDFVQNEFGLKAGNARRDGERLFDLVSSNIRYAQMAAS